MLIDLDSFSWVQICWVGNFICGKQWTFIDFIFEFDACRFDWVDEIVVKRLVGKCFYEIKVLHLFDSSYLMKANQVTIVKGD